MVESKEKLKRLKKNVCVCNPPIPTPTIVIPIPPLFSVPMLSWLVHLR